jgi:voltage-gated potassium channel
VERLSIQRRELLLERLERWTEWPLLLLAILWVAMLGVPLFFTLTAAVEMDIDELGLVIWVVFLVDLTEKLAIAPRRLEYLRRHWADVVLVLVPFLRPLRIVRVVVVGIALWGRYQRVVTRRGMHRMVFLVILLIGVAAFVVANLEREAGGEIRDYGAALWWAMATVTTVGYGDVTPETPLARAVAVVLMLVGIAVFGVLTANLAAAFSQEDSDPKILELLERVRKIEALLEEQGARAELDAEAPPEEPQEEPSPAR